MIKIQVQGVATSQIKEGEKDGKKWGCQTIDVKQDGKTKKLTYWFRSLDKQEGQPLQEYQHYEFDGQIATRKDKQSGYFYNDIELVNAREL